MALRTNLIYNPSFEVDLSNTVLENNGTLGATLTKIIVGVEGTSSGIAAAKVSIPNMGTEVEEWRVKLKANNTNPLNFITGHTYTLSAYIRSSVAGHAVKFAVEDGTGSNYYSGGSVLTTSRVRYTYTFTANATGTGKFMVICNDGSAVDIFFDSLMAEEGATASTYFDGSSPGAGDNAYQWTGTPHNSPSEEIVSGTKTRTYTADAYKRSATVSDFFSPCNNLGDFTNINIPTGSTETIEIVGGEMKQTLNSTSGETAVRKQWFNNMARRVRVKYRIDATANISGDHCFLNIWRDNYEGDLVQVRIEPIGSQFRIKFIDSNTSYSALIATKRLNKGTTYEIDVRITDYAFTLYVDGEFQIDYKMRTGTDIGAIALGKFFTTGFSGIQYFDDVRIEQPIALPPAPTTPEGKILDVYQGFKNRYIKASGKVVRPNPDGYNSFYQPWSDIVSESIAYGMLLAVQCGDQSSVDSIEAWTYAHMDRRNNSLTRGANLMGWLYAEDVDQMLDWNWATDADIDRCRALLWAHARWGSGGTINYLARATAIFTDLRLYSFRTYDGKNYFMSDSFQETSQPAEINISYHDTASFRLFKQYDPTNATFWDAAVAGSHDLLTRAITPSYGFSQAVGLPPDWLGFNTSTGLVGTVGSRSTKYSYDAFRTGPRYFLEYLFYNDSALITAMAPYASFMGNEWITRGLIYAEYAQNGVPLFTYESSIFYWSAYMVRKTVSGDTIADAIYNNKLSGMYIQDWSVGSYFGGPSPIWNRASYYGDAWNTFGEMVHANFMINYGQTGLSNVKSRIHSTDAVKKGSIIKLHSTDTYLRTSSVSDKEYSREAKVSLPATDSSLATAYSTNDISAVQAIDAVRVPIQGVGYLIHQFKNKGANNTTPIVITWTGRVRKSATTSPVLLQIFNRNTSAWETLASNNTIAGDTDFTLTGTKTANLTNYYDGSFWISCRVYQQV